MMSLKAQHARHEERGKKGLAKENIFILYVSRAGKRPIQAPTLEMS